MARVGYVTREELPEPQRSLLAAYSKMGDQYTPHIGSPSAEYRERGHDAPPRLCQAMENNPPVLEAFPRMVSRLRAECGLDELRRKIFVLTVARVPDSEYEWHQHVRIGREVGLTIAEIRAISAGRQHVFDDSETVLIEYVTQL